MIRTIAAISLICLKLLPASVWGVPLSATYSRNLSIPADAQGVAIVSQNDQINFEDISESYYLNIDVSSADKSTWVNVKINGKSYYHIVGQRRLIPIKLLNANNIEIALRGRSGTSVSVRIIDPAETENVFGPTKFQGSFKPKPESKTFTIEQAGEVLIRVNTESMGFVSALLTRVELNGVRIFSPLDFLFSGSGEIARLVDLETTSRITVQTFGKSSVTLTAGMRSTQGRELLSPGILSLRDLSTDQPNSLISKDIVLDLSGATFSLEEPPQVTINDEPVPPESVDLGAQTLSLRGVLVNGKNRVSIRTVDQNDRLIVFDKAIWAGQNTISLKAVDLSGMSVPNTQFQMRVRDIDVFVLGAIAVDGSVVFENVPDGQYELIALSQEAYLALNLAVYGDITGVVPLVAAEVIELEPPTSSIAARVISNQKVVQIGIDFNATESIGPLIVVDNRGVPKEVKTNLRLGNYVFQLPIEPQTVSAKVKYRINDLATRPRSNPANASFGVGTRYLQSGDGIRITDDPTVFESTVPVFRGQGAAYAHIQVAYFEVDPAISLTIESITLQTTALINFELVDLVYDEIGTFAKPAPLSSVSIDSQNRVDLFGRKTIFNGQISLQAGFEDKIQDLTLEIEQGNTTVNAKLTPTSLRLLREHQSDPNSSILTLDSLNFATPLSPVYPVNEGIFELSSFDAFGIQATGIEDEDYLRLTLVVQTIFEKVEFPLRSPGNPSEIFNLPLLAYYQGLGRFSDRDEDQGGDSWGRKRVLNALDDFQTAIQEGIENETLPADYFFRVNDISNMHGGRFEPHKAHQRGTDVDCKVNGFPTPTQASEGVRPGRVAALNLARFLRTIGPDGRRKISQILVAQNVEFREEIRRLRAIEQDGKPTWPGLGLLTNERNHTSHFHIKFVQRVDDFPKVGKLKGGN